MAITFWLKNSHCGFDYTCPECDQPVVFHNRYGEPDLDWYDCRCLAIACDRADAFPENQEEWAAILACAKQKQAKDELSFGDLDVPESNITPLRFKEDD